MFTLFPYKPDGSAVFEHGNAPSKWHEGSLDGLITGGIKIM